MSPTIFFKFIATPLALLLSLYVALWLGVKLRARHQKGSVETDSDGLGVVDGAVFGLMGLLLAFTFSGAATRFDTRRVLVVDEANAIGTAWLRVDLLPTADQPAVRKKFEEYVDSRLDSYKVVANETAFRAGLARSGELQGELWKLAVASSQKAPTTVPGMLLLPALNEMFDIVNTRSGHMLMHPPAIVYVLLIIVLGLCGVLAGYRMGSTDNWSKLHRLSFVFILGITYYVIIDLEYPRIGLMRVDNYDQFVVQVRDSMNQPAPEL